MDVEIRKRLRTRRFDEIQDPLEGTRDSDLSSTPQTKPIAIFRWAIYVDAD